MQHSTPLDDQQISQILAANDQMASKGLRVLGFAYRTLTETPSAELDENHEQNLVWLGLVGMLDAPRPEVKAAVEECRAAGIRPVMITGDHQLTAKAIAVELGIAQLEDTVLTGQQLQQMSDLELEQHVDLVNIYARVAPEHKLELSKHYNDEDDL